MPKKRPNIYDNILPGDHKQRLSEYDNTGIQEEKKLKKVSFNLEADVIDDLEFLQWFYKKRTLTELMQEILRDYIEGKQEVLKKARQIERK